MRSFRAFLAVIFLAVAGYTGVVATAHGLNLLPVFFGDIARLGWPGQFNLDFTCLLLLSGLWVGWRHHFRPAGLVLGGLAIVGGSLFLSAYLSVVLGRVRGDVPTLLLGPERVERLNRR